MLEGFSVAEPGPGSAGTIERIVFSSDNLPAELDDRARYALWQNLHEEHFGSTDLYNRCFRRRFGASPLQYRWGDASGPKDVGR
jgi:hypothetical protein